MGKKMIRILFYTGDDFVSRVVKKVTKSELTHASIQVDKFHIVEAAIGKPLSIKHFQDYSKVVDFVDIYLTEWQYDTIVKKIMEELDKEYDVEDIISFLIPFVKGSDRKRICTEFIIEVLKVIGYKFEDKLYSPQELYATLKEIV